MLQELKQDRLMTAIINNSVAADDPMMFDFLMVVQHLYQHSIFKNILDIVVTKCSLGQLQFKIQDAKFFDLDAGNCLTMVDDKGCTTDYKKNYKKKYLITIKKIACDVIIHEIAHMLEKELSHLINLPAFASTLMYEVESLKVIHMQSLVKSLFVDQVKSYPQSQHFSELFARFFQFFAGANEVSFQSSLGSRYKLQDAVSVFPKTLELLDSQLSNDWGDLIDPQVAKDSVKYSQASLEYKERWVGKRVPMPKATSAAKKWNIKSNKEDPFK